MNDDVSSFDPNNPEINAKNTEKKATSTPSTSKWADSRFHETSNLQDEEKPSIEPKASDLSDEEHLLTEVLSNAELKQKVTALTAELDGLKEVKIRSLAEVDNIKRRSQNEIVNARKFALERFIRELLPVVDTLELALQVDISQGDNFAKSMFQGVEYTLEMFYDALKRSELTIVDPLHQLFDPTQHEAIGMEESLDHEPNTVIKVMQKGYKLHDRVLRPAKVMLARG